MIGYHIINQKSCKKCLQNAPINLAKSLGSAVMVSDLEWKQLVEEKLYQIEELKAERSCQHEETPLGEYQKLF